MSETKPVKATQQIELRGHIIDSQILSRVWSAIMQANADFDLLEIQVGRNAQETSYARMNVIAANQKELDALLDGLEQLGVELVNAQNAQCESVEIAGVLPDDFYATTNLPTEVLVNGFWLNVENIEMDVAIIVEESVPRAYCLPMHKVQIGQQVVVGRHGVRVHPLEIPRPSAEHFSFMQSSVSSERAKSLLIAGIADEIFEIYKQRGKIGLVLGPAVVHTGARKYIEELITMGHVQAIFAGNAVAEHDCEAAMFGISLGVDLQTGDPVQDGHRNHLRAINTIRRYGSLQAAVDAGILRDGIMKASVLHHVELALAGSIRDDGPIPDVITEMFAAQDRMRSVLQNIDMVIMLASMLHSIATGNMLPASTKAVVVDINPAVVTKLADRGTTHAAGIVTDVELFLRELVDNLKSKRL